MTSFLNKGLNGDFPNLKKLGGELGPHNLLCRGVQGKGNYRSAQLAPASQPCHSVRPRPGELEFSSQTDEPLGRTTLFFRHPIHSQELVPGKRRKD